MPLKKNQPPKKQGADEPEFFLQTEEGNAEPDVDISEVFYDVTPKDGDKKTSEDDNADDLTNGQDPAAKETDPACSDEMLSAWPGMDHLLKKIRSENNEQ